MQLWGRDRENGRFGDYRRRRDRRQHRSLDDALEPWICRILAQPGLDPYLDTVYQNLRLIAAGVTTVLHSHYPRTGAPKIIADLAKYVIGKG